jgi:uracil-DNA glycosylase family 4
MSLIQRLWSEYSKCSKCTLCETRKTVVFGNGNEKADILIVKSNPTMNEDIQGTYLTPDLKFLIQCFRKAVKSRKSLDITGDIFLESCFITSAVLCRPTFVEGAFIGQDRKAQPKEVKLCADRLYKTIYAVDPKVIVAFGRNAISQLKSISNTKTKARQTGEVGEVFTALVPGLTLSVPYSVIPAPCLELAEVNGDYDYEDGKVLSVVRALQNAVTIVKELNQEDTF